MGQIWLRGRSRSGNSTPAVIDGWVLHIDVVDTDEIISHDF